MSPQSTPETREVAAEPAVADRPTGVEMRAELDRLFLFHVREGDVAQLLTWLTANGFRTADDLYYDAPEPVHPPSALSVAPYRAQQTYLDELGWANASGEAGGPVRLIDVEQGWTLSHEQFEEACDADRLQLLAGENHLFRGHGTSVLGVLISAHAPVRGGVGMLPSLTIGLVSQHYKAKTGEIEYSTAAAIATAIESGFLSSGDILLIQAQYLHKTSGLLLPVEVEPAVKRAIRWAVAEEILVIEAAGNGSAFLTRDSTNSGAVLVGAATSLDDMWPDPHRPLFFSNRGHGVQCYAWGEEVTTSGDGETSEELDDYTGEFGGTSAAASIIAGVAAVVQSVARKRGYNLTGSQLKRLLIDPTNGIPLALGSDPIGTMPSLAKIVKKLQ
ncbi:MAG TPA: S8 family serine peptidase [Thermoanaerobaculia bacterium]|jgi:subtilisin family serine protease